MTFLFSISSLAFLALSSSIQLGIDHCSAGTNPTILVPLHSKEDQYHNAFLH